MPFRRFLNRTLVYQINREEAPPVGKPTVQLNRTLEIPELLRSRSRSQLRSRDRSNAAPLVSRGEDMGPTTSTWSPPVNGPENRLLVYSASF